MAATMHVEVVSAEKHVFTGEVSELYARGVAGEIGILPGHQPALVALEIGAMKLVKADGSTDIVAVHRGVLYVGKDGKVIVLADIAELADTIDVARADAKRQELERRLHDAPTDSQVLAASLKKQQIRLDVAARATAEMQGRS
jgi:F-type H+-transporting ATPase subunit epsilon